MTDAVREAIEAADADALRALVAADPSLAEADVTWGDGGKNRVPPLHFVCDSVFRKLASQERALEMADVLLEAGVDPNLAYAKSGDTFLIAAASLGAELVGLRLLERGADVHARGLFRATALHWCAMMGLDRLAAATLDAGSELELKDGQYDCTPLEWTLHAWFEGCNGYRERLPDVAKLLVSRGARVPEGVGPKLTRPGDPEMAKALELTGA